MLNYSDVIKQLASSFEGFQPRFQGLMLTDWEGANPGKAQGARLNCF